MKKATFLFFFLFAFLSLQAQPPSSLKDPVKWSSKIEKKSDTEYVLVFDAVIEKDWHMYSQYTADGGALPLEVLFNNDKNNFEAIGKAEESKTEKAFNETFGVEETFWSHTAQIKQNIKITNPKSEIVQIELAYQACKEVCIQGSNLFEFNIKTLTCKEVKSFEELVVPVTAEKKKR